MTTKHDSDCLENAADDEPIFVLRAQDALAQLIVEKWADLAESLNCSPAKVNKARDVAAAMRMWAISNETKLPD